MDLKKPWEKLSRPHSGLDPTLVVPSRQYCHSPRSPQPLLQQRQPAGADYMNVTLLTASSLFFNCTITLYLEY